MKKSLLIVNLLIIGLLLTGAALAQMPAAITIEPENATVYDEITLTFDPLEACFQSGSLTGNAYVAMHSGITVNGNPWQNVIEFNGTGANGQSPILSFNPDGTYSITFVPYDFYGFAPGVVVTQICAVFNNGTGWNQDGRDFEPGTTNCIDFFIPIDPGSPPADPFLHSIVPDNCDIGESVNVQIFGLNTHFQDATNNAWIAKDGNTISFTSLFAPNDTLLSAQISVPGDAIIGNWNLYVENLIDDTIVLVNGFTVNDTVSYFPFAITIDPPEPSAYDEITLTLDTRLSCPDGALLSADSVKFHSGVTIGGTTWNNVVPFDGLGVNGQSPSLIYNGDSTWSLVFIPVEYYGITPGLILEAINCVFNGGDWTLGEGKDYDQNSGDCIDFIIPLYLGSQIPEWYNNEVIIYPNPVNDFLKLNSSNNLNTYVIYTTLGNVEIHEKIVGSNSSTIDVSSLSPGVYFIEGYTEGQKSFHKKFIKK
ncbi:MAG: T9SS type A sorting domain-containing protein [Bacteroidales bacterium]|nr:T9SS type A sorting domain-containing protein [Bacteroidales bacterium]MCF8403857.1 T9SS type A sorting domain-containing protein [Bacteroidales bacterium]